MRTIKFRIWDSKYKCWFTNKISYYPAWPKEEDQLSLLDQIKYQDDDDYIIQQFTGLKDQNDQEVYEGDIVKYLPSYSADEGWQLPPEFYEVKFADGCFCVDGMPSSQSDMAFYEVVGNICENPKLIK